MAPTLPGSTCTSGFTIDSILVSTLPAVGIAGSVVRLVSPVSCTNNSDNSDCIHGRS